MSPIIWDSCRRADGTINLEQAARQTGCWFSNHALNYLVMVEKIMPINSRQVAAAAVASAMEISARDTPPGDGESA